MSITPETTQAWRSLHITTRALVDQIEVELKAQDLPDLSWYDALWEIEKAGEDGIRPHRLMQRLLLPQYHTSRLLDRLIKAGLVERIKCPEDRRGFRAAITAAGRTTRHEMWAVYEMSLESLVQKKLGKDELVTLTRLLNKLR